MRALMPTPRPLARPRPSVFLTVAALFCITACASGGTDGGGGSRGTSGVVTWEVTDIGRLASADNRMLRWSYVIAIRNTGDRAIQLDRVERALFTTDPNATGGTPTSRPYEQRIEARATIRYAANETWGWRQTTGASARGVETLPVITSYRRFFGSVERGGPIKIEARVRLDSSVGALAKPPTKPETLPAPRQLGSSDLAAVVGLWRGSYRADNSVLDIPIEVDIQPDGTVRVAENLPVTNHFTRTVQVKDGGLEYSGNRDRGALTLHEVAGKRILVGRVSPPDGAAYAVYLEAQSVAAPTSPAGSPPPATAAPAMSPTPGPAASQSSPEILTNESILAMVQNGLTDEVILSKIAATPTRFDTRTEALIALKQAGVPDRVLAAMVGKR